MNTEPRIEQPATEPTPVKTPRPDPVQPLAEVVREVRDDAAVQPEAYLEQTRIPADGE